MIDADISSGDNTNVCNNLKSYLVEVFASTFRKQIDESEVFGSKESVFNLNQFVSNAEIMALYLVFDQNLGYLFFQKFYFI